MKKLSSRNIWQIRYFAFNNAYLNYYGRKEDRILHEAPKGSIDLRKLIESPKLMDRFGSFCLRFGAGNEREEYFLKAGSAQKAEVWMNAIKERYVHYAKFIKRMHSLPFEAIETSCSEPEHEKALDKGSELKTRASSSGSPIAGLKSKDVCSSVADREGKLLIKSWSRFKEWEARYFRLQNGVLYCYKHETDELSDFVFQTVLDKDCSLKMDTKDASCASRFVLTTVFRVLELKAEMEANLELWAKAIEMEIERDRTRFTRMSRQADASFFAVAVRKFSGLLF